MLEPTEHPDPADAWEMLRAWLAKTARTIDGEEVTDGAIRVLLLGAWIGARLSTAFPTFGLALAEAGNSVKDPVYTPFQQSFRRDYVQWLGPIGAAKAPDLSLSGGSVGSGHLPNLAAGTRNSGMRPDRVPIAPFMRPQRALGTLSARPSRRNGDFGQVQR